MSRNCLIISRSEDALELNQKITNTFYIEDYLQVANVTEVRKLVDKIFLVNKNFIDEYDYCGYKITWSWYDEIFQFCNYYLEILDLIKVIEKLEFENLEIGQITPQHRKVLVTYFADKNLIYQHKQKWQFEFVKEFLFNFMMLGYSILSISFLSFKNQKRIGTYTGDFIFKDTKSDFRLNHLYSKYKENQINYVEFIRETTIKNFFANIVKRRKPAIYFNSIKYFVSLLTKKSIYKKTPKDFFQAILYEYHNTNIVFIKSVPFIEKILNVLKIHKFVLISFSSRSALIAIAAKSQNIKTIGIMHGLSQKEYVIQEFLESYSEKKKIGCDIFGVWSDYYLSYFKKYSKVMSPNNISYSGLLRPIENFYTSLSFKAISKKTIKILLISEPLVSVKEVVPYINSLLMHKNIEISIKVRPMIKDKYYEELKTELPKIKEFTIYDGKIEDVAQKFDVFIGSMSTAIIEACLFAKISVLLNTKKFGDYYKIDELIPDYPLLVRDSELIYDHIIDRIAKEKSLNSIGTIRNRYFGENKDGAQWILEQF